MSNDRKKKGMSVRELLGIKTFTEHGLLTIRGEVVFLSIAPVNISMLSAPAVSSKIRQLMYILSAVPDIEIVCTDQSECFDANREYLMKRMESESNTKVKKIISRDILFLNGIQMEMSTARQFMFALRFRAVKPVQVFEKVNTVCKVISEQGFDCHLMKRDEIKRILALYFEASTTGERLPDIDGSQYFNTEGEDINA